MRPPRSRAARGSRCARRRRMLPVGSSTPPSRSAQAAGIVLHRSGRRRPWSDAPRRSAGERPRRIARSSAPRASRAYRARDRPSARIASRSRATRRRTALMRPPACWSFGSSCASCTARVDGGMIRHVEKQDLRRADGEKMQQALVLRLALVEPLAQGAADGAEAAEGDDGDGAGERLVAGGEVLARATTRRARRRAARAASGSPSPPSRRGGGARGPPVSSDCSNV